MLGACNFYRLSLCDNNFCNKSFASLKHDFLIFYIFIFLSHQSSIPKYKYIYIVQSNIKHNAMNKSINKWLIKLKWKDNKIKILQWIDAWVPRFFNHHRNSSLNRNTNKFFNKTASPSISFIFSPIAGF